MNVREPVPHENGTALPAFGQTDWALRLLQFRQQLDAWDRLYNGEMQELRRDLERLTSEYTQFWELRGEGRSRRRQTARGSAPSH